jgi:hypothetical protein
MVVGHPLVATTPLASLNEEVFVTILRLPIPPDSGTTKLNGEILKMLTGFVFNKKKQLVICKMRQFFLGSLIIRGGLVYKPGPVPQLLHIGLAVILLSLGT